MTPVFRRCGEREYLHARSHSRSHARIDVRFLALSFHRTLLPCSRDFVACVHAVVLVEPDSAEPQAATAVKIAASQPARKPAPHPRRRRNLALAEGLGRIASLDTQEAARFLSYSGILLESWRGWHERYGADSDMGRPGSDSNGKLCRTGSRQQLGHAPAGDALGFQVQAPERQTGDPSRSLTRAWAGRVIRPGNARVRAS